MTAGIALAEAPQSASVLKFADETTLFVADFMGGAIHAYELTGTVAAPE